MRCPFLRGARVRYCGASAYRKFIDAHSISSTEELCTSPSWVGCPAAGLMAREDLPRDRCPGLQEADSEFCEAAPVVRYLPATRDLPSRCRSEAHLYCDAFKSFAQREATTSKELTAMPDDTPAPEHLSYTQNHMWIDISEDGYCHIGIDEFLANAIGDADEITFTLGSTSGRPGAVLKVGDADLAMTFPVQMDRVTPNYFLRIDPSRLTADPYGSGWMFEGVATLAGGGRNPKSMKSKLRSGPAVGPWLNEENHRLARFTRDHLPRLSPRGPRTMSDGGVLERGFARELNREDRIIFFNAFFAP